MLLLYDIYLCNYTNRNDNRHKKDRPDKYDFSHYDLYFFYCHSANL